MYSPCSAVDIVHKRTLRSVYKEVGWGYAINYAHAVVACAYFVGSQTVMVKVSVAGLLLALLVPRLLRVFAQVDICYVDDTKPCSCDLQDWDMTLDIDYYRGKQCVPSILECIVFC